MLGTPVRFDYTGAVQTYTVPANVIGLEVDCIGAAGGGCSSSNCNTSGGKGGRVQCNLTVTPGQTLYIYVGQVGCRGSFGETVNTYTAFNGGGTTYHGSGTLYVGACGGGGASDIRIGGTSLNDRKVVAGAGGGGAAGLDLNNRNGGNGGGLIGQSVSSSFGTGAGGTQSSGGFKGGTLGNGGAAIDDLYAYWMNYGGSGGGGYYGGGGSGSYSSGSSVYSDAFGGGGGSSYTDPTLCTDVVHTQGYSEATGNGWITLTPILPDAYNRDSTTDHVITLKLNTTTHDSFLEAGYKYDGSVNGVYLRDLAKVIPSLNIADYNYTNTSGDVVLTKYTGTDTAVVIPNIEIRYVE